MKHLIAIALAASCGSAFAQAVALQGMLGNKALLMVDGSHPKTVAPGESHMGVKVISTSGDQAVVEVGGKRHTLRVGDAPRAHALHRDRQLRRRVVLARVDALLGLGRLDEAAGLLDNPAADAGADRAHRDVLAAELALARGDRAGARRLVQAALSEDTAESRELRPRAAQLLFANGLSLPDLQVDAASDVDEVPDALLLRGIAQAVHDPVAAESDLRAALRSAARTRDLREQRDVLRALNRIAGDDTRDVDLLALAAPLASATSRDFETALLFAELHRDRHDVDNWRAAVRSAAALAGERPLPEGLAVAWINDETPPRVVRAATR